MFLIFSVGLTAAVIFFGEECQFDLLSALGLCSPDYEASDSRIMNDAGKARDKVIVTGSQRARVIVEGKVGLANDKSGLLMRSAFTAMLRSRNNTSSFPSSASRPSESHKGSTIKRFDHKDVSKKMDFLRTLSGNEGAGTSQYFGERNNYFAHTSSAQGGFSHNGYFWKLPDILIRVSDEAIPKTVELLLSTDSADRDVVAILDFRANFDDVFAVVRHGPENPGLGMLDIRTLDQRIMLCIETSDAHPFTGKNMFHNFPTGPIYNKDSETNDATVLGKSYRVLRTFALQSETARQAPPDSVSPPPASVPVFEHGLTLNSLKLERSAFFFSLISGTVCFGVPDGHDGRESPILVQVDRDHATIQILISVEVQGSLQNFFQSHESELTATVQNTAEISSEKKFQIESPDKRIHLYGFNPEGEDIFINFPPDKQTKLAEMGSSQRLILNGKDYLSVGVFEFRGGDQTTRPSEETRMPRHEAAGKLNAGPTELSVLGSLTNKCKEQDKDTDPIDLYYGDKTEYDSPRRDPTFFKKYGFELPNILTRIDRKNSRIQILEFKGIVPSMKESVPDFSTFTCVVHNNRFQFNNNVNGHYVSVFYGLEPDSTATRRYNFFSNFTSGEEVRNIGPARSSEVRWLDEFYNVAGTFPFTQRKFSPPPAAAAPPQPRARQQFSALPSLRGQDFGLGADFDPKLLAHMSQHQGIFGSLSPAHVHTPARVHSPLSARSRHERDLARLRGGA